MSDSVLLQEKYTNNKELTKSHEDQILSFAKSLLQAAKRDKETLERKWHLYDKYIIGLQDNRQGLSPLLGYAQRVIPYNLKFPTTNYLLKNYETVMGKFVKYTPKPIARPHSQKYKDRKAATMAESFIDWRYREDKDTLKLSPYYRMLLAYGTVARKIYFDKDGGKWDETPKIEMVNGKVDHPISECKICKAKYEGNVEYCDACGSDQLEYSTEQRPGKVKKETKQRKPSGTIKTDIIHPRYLYVDPMSRYWEMGNWMFEKQFHTVSWIKDKYENVDMKKIDIQASAIDFETIMNQTRNDDSTPDQQLVDSVVATYEFYVKPGKYSQFPNGLYMVMTDNVSLHIDVENGIPFADPDYVEQEFPYAFAVYRPITDRFYGEGLIDAMVNIQDQINISDLHRMKYRKLGVMPKLLVSDQSRVKTSYIHGDEIEQILYKASQNIPKPEWMQLPNLTHTLWDDRGQLVIDMADISGAADLTSNVSDRTSGRALNLKMENFEDRLRPDLKQLEHAEVTYHKKKLVIAKRYMTTDQLMTVYGEDGSIAAKEFKMSDITGGYDILVDLGSMLNRSFSLVASNIFDLADRGFLDPFDPIVRMKVLRKFGMEDMISDYSLHKNRAEYENQELKDNIDVPVQKFDNHSIHFKTCEELYLGDDFLEMEEEVQNKILKHMTEHQEAIQQEIQQQMAQQESLAGRGQQGGSEGGLPGLGGSDTLPVEAPQQFQENFGQGMNQEGYVQPDPMAVTQ